MTTWDRASIPAIAIAIVRAREAFRAAPYDDGYGNWTIGYGSLRDAAGAPVTPATRLVTVSDAEVLVRRDLDIARRSVARAVACPLVEHQAAALISLAYNLGDLAIKAPTLVARVESRDWPAAARQFGAYRMASGKPSRGLRRRRWLEAAVFLANADPGWAWQQAERLIHTADDWPPLPQPGAPAGRAA